MCRMKKTYYVYMMSNKKCGTLYTGITNDLVRRIVEHKCGLNGGFTKKYRLNKLVYYETTKYVLNGIKREKQIKGWIREKKIQLIESMNPEWRDLSKEFLDEKAIKEIASFLNMQSPW